MRSSAFARVALSVSAFSLLLTSWQEKATAQTPSTSSSTANSGDGSSTSSIPQALKSKKFEQDTQITDAKLKAEAGSLSRYSARFNFSYLGATLDDLSKPTQPNPDRTGGVQDTKLSGSIGVRYRIDSDSSVGTGTGISMRRPTYGTNQLDANNPYLGYDLTQKYGGVQVRNSPSVAIVTDPYYKSQGEAWTLGHTIGSVYVLGTSRFALTLDLTLGYYFFNRDFDRTAKNDMTASRYSISLYPGVKYRLSDSVSLVTLVSAGYTNPRRYVDESSLLPRTSTEQIGVGWAITRDIYLNPYVNVILNNVAWNTTTVNVSTVFSVL